MLDINWYIRTNLKLRHLKLLVALDDLGNVGRVASHLHITQPAVSKTLIGLEKALNARLFNRTQNGMEPTEHGAVLIRHARDILSQLEQARGELTDLSEGRVARVSMGVLPAATTSLIPRFISQLEEVSSDVAIDLREDTTDVLLSALHAGEIDLAVGALPVHTQGSDFRSELLYRDSLLLVTRKGHPLTQRKHLEWSHLSDFPMVLPPTSALTRSTIDQFMLEHGVHIPRRYITSISTMINVGVLYETDSVGFLSRDIVRHFTHFGMLQMLPLRVDNLFINIGLIWPANRSDRPALQLVRQLLHEVSAEIRGRDE